jgi:hypothetical protein
MSSDAITLGEVTILLRGQWYYPGEVYQAVADGRGNHGYNDKKEGPEERGDEVQSISLYRIWIADVGILAFP